MLAFKGRCGSDLNEGGALNEAGRYLARELNSASSPHQKSRARFGDPANEVFRKLLAFNDAAEVRSLGKLGMTEQRGSAEWSEGAI